MTKARRMIEASLGLSIDAWAGLMRDPLSSEIPYNKILDSEKTATCRPIKATLPTRTEQKRVEYFRETAGMQFCKVKVRRKPVTDSIKRFFAERTGEIRAGAWAASD